MPAFYAELIANGQLERAQAEKLGQELIDTIVASPKLRAMAKTPLLLTMMVLVLYHDGPLPRDRPLLYERILELLLGQWDKLREGQSLAEAIGQPDWDSERIRPLLDQLSYQAHDTASSEDGRGRLRRGRLHRLGRARDDWRFGDRARLVRQQLGRRNVDVRFRNRLFREWIVARERFGRRHHRVDWR